jgi:DNA polymerase-4
MDRLILHLDMDAFFAAVELLRHPELKGRPVVVGGDGDPMQRGVVSTASYEARRFGIHSAMPLRTAYHLCPNAVFLPVDYRTYEKESIKIKALLSEFSSRIENVGIDEAFLDISHCHQSPENFAKAIKACILEETGLTCSIGIAPNKLLAKLASDMDKPGGLTILSGKDVPFRVWPLPVRKLWGVGPKTEKRLLDLGVATIGDLAGLPLTTLVARFGRAHGAWLHQAARGVDISPLVGFREPRSFGRETTFQRDIEDPALLAEVTDRLAGDVAARLKRGGYRCRTVTIKLRYADFETHLHAMTLASLTDDPEIIGQAARRCLDRFSLEKRVRLIGVRLSGVARSTQRGEYGT